MAGLEGHFLLGFCSAPLAAIGGALVGLGISAFADPETAVPLSILIALVLLAVRVARVSAVFDEHVVVVRNLLTTRRIARSDVERIVASNYSAAPRPLPAIALLTYGDGHARRIKIHASVRVRRSTREKVLAWAASLGLPADGLADYLEY